jgi:hypothetical protein
VQLWSTDQHRIGLKPILRRIWVRRGSRPRVKVQQRYEWLYVYSFVQPSTGQSEWYLLPSVTAEIFSIALSLFAQAVGAGLSKRVLLVLDQAGWHSSQELVVPEGIHLLSLPPYSPELQRMSSACGRSRAEGVANEAFRSLDELEEAQVQRCIVLQNQPEVIRSHTCFHWWPPANSKHQ